MARNICVSPRLTVSGLYQSSDLQIYIGSLVNVDRTLAQNAYDDAISANGNAKKLDEAKKHLKEGDALALANKPNDAISHYKSAWENARDSMK
jgi:hypothetical protein